MLPAKSYKAGTVPYSIATADFTADERVVLPPAVAEIFHPYSDAPEEGIEVLAYDYVEAFAEKFRALAERTSAQVVVLAPSVGSVPGAETYLKLFDHNVATLAKALAAAP